MKKISILIVMLVLGLAFLGAQTIAEYTFSNTVDGTLEDMTGSSNFTNLTPGSYYDDTASGVTDIGFTFALGTGAYTQFSVNSNGQMQLGPTAVSGGSASPAANLPRLAPISGDNAIRATGKVHYKLVGTQPNRKLVVEWLDLRVNYGGAAETGTYCRLQAWLYEGSNNIKFVYGTMWNMSTSSQSRSVYVATSNVAGSLGQVTDILNTMTWTNNGTSLVNTSFPASSAMTNLDSAADGARRVFHISYPVYTNPPNQAVLVSPSNGGWALLGSTLSWQSGGGGATSYDVYFGTTDTPDFIQNQGATSYTPTLEAGVTYYWRIDAVNEYGTTTGALWNFKVPTTTQVAESFEVVTPFLPVGWANPGSWSGSTSYFKHGARSAYKYGSSSTQYILSTPKVAIGSTSTLDLWTLVSSNTGILQIVYSPDRSTWTQLGGNITHAASATWYNSVVDLSSLAGYNYYLGIRTGMQAVSFYVDLVIGPEVALETPGAPELVAPADLAVDVNTFTMFSWNAPTTGGVPQGYNLYLDTVDGSTLYASNVTSPYTVTTALEFTTPYFWTVAAYNGVGTGPAAAVRSFTTWADPTVVNFPYTESFDGTTFAPLGWTNVRTAGTGTPGIWDRQITGTNPACVPYSGAGMARYNGYSLSAGTKGELVTPPLAVPNGEDFRVTFWMYRDSGYSTYDQEVVNVYVNEAPTSVGATLLGTISRYYGFAPVAPVANAWYEYNFPFAGSAAYKYVVFEAVSQFGNNMFIDHITVEEVPVAPIFTYAPSSINFGTVMNATLTGPQNVTVTNTGGGTLSIVASDLSLSGTNAAEFSFDTANLPASLGAGQSVVIPVYVTAVNAGPLTATLTIANGDTRTNYDVALSANGMPAGLVTVGNGTANLNVPIYPYFGYSYSQSIFLQSELNTANQRIEKVYYQWNGGLEGVNSNDWVIYMGHTPNTEFSSTTGWQPLSAMIQVFAGTVALPATPGWIEIILDTPFVYNNTDNLIIAVDENEDSYEINSAGFFYNTAATTNRSIRYYSDSTNPNPAAPPTGSLVLGYPNVMLQFADIPVGGPGAPILTYPANLATDLPLAGFNLTWSANPEGGLPSRYMVYMAGDETDILESEFQWETVNTYFNPITEGGFEYYYEDTWYWTVKAINLNGEAAAAPFSFTIQADPAIVNYPWNEDFEDASFPPSGWTTADLDGTGTYWMSSTSYNHTTGGSKSAKHGYSTAAPEPGQNGWLITPPATIPDSEYDVVLSWWNYNAYPTWMIYNGVLVNNTPDPNDANWVELWSQDVASSAWTNEIVDISAYAGETVYFAFNYQGYDGDDWFVDDVSIYELTVDQIPPSITHLPVLNTPRPDLNYLVYAEIVDDATWNSPIGGANLYYSIDGGTNWSTAIPMNLDVAPGYYAFIPAQPLGTTVAYYIEAWDTEDNLATSDVFGFGVNDPTWVWYDQGGTIYLGYTTTEFGPMVQFNNPFYGTGTPMILNATDGSSYYGNNANLQIYTWDGVGDLMPFFATPLPIVFGAQTYEVFDLTNYDIQITDPYFFVSYENIPAGNYILFDGTYDYGTTYVWQGTTLYIPSNPGSWAIGANIQSGSSATPEAPVVSIALLAGEPTLSWNAVDGANAYNVYGSADPYAAEPWTLLQNTASLSYSYAGDEAYEFFMVKADSDAPARAYVGNGRRFNRNAPESRLNNAPKGVFKLNKTK